MTEFGQLWTFVAQTKTATLKPKVAAFIVRDIRLLSFLLLLLVQADPSLIARQPQEWVSTALGL